MKASNLTYRDTPGKVYVHDRGRSGGNDDCLIIAYIVKKTKEVNYLSEGASNEQMDAIDSYARAIGTY